MKNNETQTAAKFYIYSGKNFIGAEKSERSAILTGRKWNREMSEVTGVATGGFEVYYNDRLIRIQCCNNFGESWTEKDNLDFPEDAVKNPAAVALGKMTSTAKKKSSAANGKKGGAPKKTYYLLSGEGEGGTWSGPFVTTGRAIRMRAKKEECGGDRWCSIWELSPETDERIACVVNIDNDDMRDVPDTDED